MNGNNATAYLHKARLHMNGLPPGSYVLTIEVQSQAKGTPSASRQVPFTISQ
jgi:hypothetical protein